MWRDLRRVLALWKPRNAALAFGIVIAMLSALSGVALMALAGKGVAAGVAAGGAGLVGVAALLWVRPFVAIRPSMRWWERMASHEAAFRALADTRVWFFNRLAERMPGGIGRAGSGDLLGRIVGDVDSLDRLYLGAIIPAAAALAVVLAVAVLLGAEPALLLVVAVPLALALVLPLALAPAAARATHEAAEARGVLRAAAVDPLLGTEDTLAANAEARATRRLAGADAALMAAQRDVSRRSAMAGAAGSLLTQFALLGALGWGLWTGSAGAGFAVLALFLCIAAAEALGLMPRAGGALAAAGAGARRLFEAADRSAPVAEPAAPAPLPADSSLRFEAVRFGWTPGGPPVLDGLDLEVAEGERVAILGPSGAGKSSLAALLAKVAAPQAGRITLGGTDISALAAGDVRTRIALLSQNARLFDATIAENLRIAAPEAPEAALWRVLAKAGMAETVRALPEGLETRCGEGGANFSGGQARRLALARALLPPSRILVLDEPTTGLDEETERAFLATLAQAAEGRSVLLVTHRLTGAEELDRVYRLVRGRLVPAAA
jgi:ATP-binding cassette subfamily C protein CydC